MIKDIIYDIMCGLLLLVLAVFSSFLVIVFSTIAYLTLGTFFAVFIGILMILLSSFGIANMLEVI